MEIMLSDNVGINGSKHGKALVGTSNYCIIEDLPFSQQNSKDE